MGCGQVSPIPPDDPAEPLPTIEIGSDGTAASDLLAALYVAALQASDDPAVTTEVVAGTETLALGDNSPMAMPAFAGTLLQEFSNQPLPAEPAETIAYLATEVAPEVGVLETSWVDGGLVWAATPDSGLASLSDLAVLPQVVAAVPSFAVDSSVGVPVLQAAYNAKATAEQLDDPAERAAALADGSATIAAFRRTESIDLEGLVELEDPVGVGVPDPLVVVVSAEFADQRPDAVLVLDAVQQALTNDSFAELTAAAAADGLDTAIAAWLGDHGLAG
ncbi:MAG: hypothetical protein LCH76_09920 [Actinobacteria bacterium]|nr:hypothetical protein [Actinomycetota bacterium]